MRTRLLVALAILSATAVRAEVIDVVRDAQGRFDRELQVSAGKFVELCEKLPANAAVRWRFEAQAPLDFNVHYHEGKDVKFPARQGQSTGAEGVLNAALAQHYCWMWTNKGNATVKLTVQTQRL